MAEYDLYSPSFSYSADMFSQTVIITGGSDGMGKSVAIQLAKKGANILIVARNVEKLQAALKEISVCH